MSFLKNIFGSSKKSNRGERGRYRIKSGDPWMDNPERTQKVIDRNAKAQQLEEKGKVDKAIELYEKSVSEGFFGSLPYDRLRILYNKQKRHDDAIRVCQAYVDNPHITGKGNEKHKNVMRDWIKKYEVKKAKASS